MWILYTALIFLGTAEAQIGPPRQGQTPAAPAHDSFALSLIKRGAKDHDLDSLISVR
jgi:hypothetical protein